MRRIKPHTDQKESTPPPFSYPGCLLLQKKEALLAGTHPETVVVAGPQWEETSIRTGWRRFAFWGQRGEK